MDDATIYFDHNATTTLDSRVLEAMLPFMQRPHGNPNSRHSQGRAARQAIDRAREQVAAAVNAHPTQVTFTSGGTESDNMAVFGMTATQAPSQIAISAIEHPAVSRPAQSLLSRGWKLAKVAVHPNGQLDQAHLSAVLQQPTALVSVMAANNETGVLQDIAAIAGIASSRGAYVHTDAVQALGKIPLDFNALGVNAMSLSSHKIYGPQGAGALILDKRVDIQPLIYGGGQEKGLRSGTENIAAIVGFGLACELAQRALADQQPRITQLRNQLEHGLLGLGAIVFGSEAPRLPNTSFFAFPNLDGETLVMALDRKGFAVASGSACSSDSTEPSQVLLAMQVEPTVARGAVRISLGAGNIAAEIEAFLLALENELSRIKRMAAIAV